MSANGKCVVAMTYKSETPKLELNYHVPKPELDKQVPNPKT